VRFFEIGGVEEERSPAHLHRLCWRASTPQEDMNGGGGGGEKLIYRNFMGCQCERFKLKAIKYPGREPPFVGIPQRRRLPFCFCREILKARHFVSPLSLSLSLSRSLLV
jgi:hypothetical protein